ncbi:MAG: glycosyltransferase family 2 protein [Nanoarchaeota archaeon]
MISIVITACREPSTVSRAISSVLSQKIKNSEIIVVAPDKETLNKAKKYRVKIVHDKGRGKPAALNLVFKKAKGNILVLTDGDVYLEKNSIKLLLAYFKDGNVGAVTGRPVATDNRKTLLGYWANLLNDAAHLERIRRDKENLFIFCSGYLFAMRNIIKKIPENCLDDAYISSLIAKKGRKIRYSPNSKTYIKNPSTFSDWVMQKRRNAAGHEQIRKDLGIVMKSLKNEIIYGWYKALTYPKNFREFIYTVLLFPARLYTWLLSFYDLKLKRRKVIELWKRIESTK